MDVIFLIQKTLGLEMLNFKMQQPGEREKLVIELDRKACLKLFEEYKNIADHQLY